MNKRQKEDLVRLARGNIRFGCAMAEYTTFHVGGEAEALFEAHEMEAFLRVHSYLCGARIPCLIVGRGSNLLVKDEGISGVVILLRGSLAGIEQESREDPNILAGAGLAISDLLIHCRGCGLGGLEFLAGIPGTVGGAVAMNAGAYGGQIGSHVSEIVVVTSRGRMSIRKKEDLRFSYRRLEMERGGVILRVRFRLRLDSEEDVAERIAGYLKKRRGNQPLEYPSAGSVFENPPGDHAGRLIEKAGLKGERIGGAMISEKHANFIVNTGGATAKDILALLAFAQEKVKKETGIELEPELHVVGR
jgi:UDP-N-acetylmuramate dehydrogenase